MQSHRCNTLYPKSTNNRATWLSCWAEHFAH